MSVRKRTKSLKEHGIAVLEMAIALVALIWFCAGAIDLALTLEEQALLLEAARAGARAATQGDIDDAGNLKNATEEGIEEFLEAAGRYPADYTIHVRGENLNVTNSGSIPAVRVSVAKTANSDAHLLLSAYFIPCAATVFRVQSNVLPTSTAGDPLC